MTIGCHYENCKHKFMHITRACHTHNSISSQDTYSPWHIFRELQLHFKRQVPLSVQRQGQGQRGQPSAQLGQPSARARGSLGAERLRTFYKSLPGRVRLIWALLALRVRCSALGRLGLGFLGLGKPQWSARASLGLVRLKGGGAQGSRLS